MNRNILVTLIVLFFAKMLHSQCTPDESIVYPDGWGIYPDSSMGFSPAVLNEPYTQVLYFKTPKEVQDVQSSGCFPFCSTDIKEVKLLNIFGLPLGMNFSNSVTCDNIECTWDGDEHGCIVISGTPTISGTFNLLIKLNGKAGNPVVMEDDFTISDYRIEVSGPTNVISPNQFNHLLDVKAYPNPFNDKFLVEFNTKQPSVYILNLYDVTGKVVSTQRFNAQSGLNSILVDEVLEAGTYIYELKTLSDQYNQIARGTIHKQN